MRNVNHELRGEACGGQSLIDALEAATRWLEANSARINSLNVYPVPDGDTGTNMLLTMKSALVEANRSPSNTVSEASQAIYKGALMGARGNSGVILSQMLRGFASTVQGREALSPSELAAALREASDSAYRGVITPVEGTMLTVIRDIAQAAEEVVGREDDHGQILQQVLAAGRRSVAHTPELLDVLRDAGVVDAGGEGLCVILEGILQFLQGQHVELESPVASAAMAVVEASTGDEIRGYCTEFLIAGQALDLDAIKAKMVSLGSSVLVVGDELLVRVHLHTTNPGVALEYALENGALHQIKIDNLEDQHREFVSSQAASRKAASSAAVNGISLVAVATGEGMVEVFGSLGVAEVVSGGETMNPSTDDLLKAVESAPTDVVILLPNDRNVIPVAEQVTSIARKSVEVIPTETMPQGIAALLAFNYQAGLTENVEAMWNAARGTRTVQVTRSVRKASLNGLAVEEGQMLGLLDGKPVVTGVGSGDVVLELLARVRAELREVITVYRGRDAERDQAEHLVQTIRSVYSEVQVELVYGGQSFYDYIVSVE